MNVIVGSFFMAMVVVVIIMAANPNLRPYVVIGFGVITIWGCFLLHRNS